MLTGATSLRRPLAALFLALPLLLGAAIDTPDRDQVVPALESDGFFVAPDAEQVDSARLAAIARDSRVDLRPVILDAPPPQGEEPFAHDLLDDLRTGTVIVVSRDGLGVATDRRSDAEVETALDRADEQVSSLADLAGYLEAFDAALAGAGGGSGEPGTRRGLPVGPIIVGVLVLLGGGLLIGRVRARRVEAQRAERALQEARTEVGQQISHVADRIVALHDEVELAGRPQLSERYNAATEAYTTAQREVGSATTLAELERASDRLDRARWHLESVTAVLEGRQPPAEPERAMACFFDPDHGAGTYPAELETAAGTRDVRVCRACAAKLEAGEAPQPRMVTVDGRQVPAAKAPRSYGGGGFGWLDDFVVILGGRRRRYGWGSMYAPRYRRRARRPGRGGGGWGTGGWGGGWTSGRTTPRRSGWTGSWTGGSGRRGGASRSRVRSSRGGASRSRRGGASRSRRGGASRRRR